MKCPRCGQLVSRHQRVEALAQCPACDHIWELTPPRRRVMRAVVEADIEGAPPGLAVDLLPRGIVEVQVPWSQSLGPLVHAPLGTLVVVPAAFVVGLGFIWPILPVALLLWVYLVTNKTTITSGPDGLAVRHDPLPVPLPAEAIWQGRLRPERAQRVRTAVTSLVGGLGVHRLDVGAKTVFWSVDDAVVAYLERVVEASVPVTSGDPAPSVDRVRGSLASDLSDPRGAPLLIGVSGAVVHELDGGGYVVDLPWNRSIPMWVTAVLMCLAIPTAFTTPILVPLALIGPALLAYTLRNKTTVTIRPESVTVEQGPLPVPDLLAPRSHQAHHVLRDLEIITTHVMGEHTSIARYTLKGGGGRLLVNWAERPKLELVKNLIERTMGGTPST